MTHSLSRLETTLKQHGYSITTSRKLVFQTLEQSKPVSMNHLVAALIPTINRASVYRTIELFESLGIVQRLQIGWKYKLELSNDFQEHHHHLTCGRCGTIIPFHEPSRLHQVLQDVASLHEFSMQHHQIELQGVCRSCREVSKS